MFDSKNLTGQNDKFKQWGHSLVMLDLERSSHKPILSSDTCLYIILHKKVPRNHLCALVRITLLPRGIIRRLNVSATRNQKPLCELPGLQNSPSVEIQLHTTQPIPKNEQKIYLCNTHPN